MGVYSVHMRRGGRDPDRDLAIVREGFSWPAFLFTFLWAAFNRMWLLAIIIFIILGMLGLAGEFLLKDPLLDAVLSLLITAAFGAVAADLRRWWLDRQGFREVTLIAARNADEALRRFLDGAEINEDGIFV